MNHSKQEPSRREFIRRTGSVAMGAFFVPASDALVRSRVVVVRDQNALDADSFRDSAINPSVVQTMMDAGMKRLVDIDDIGEAWKSLFPGISKKTIIGIKVNSLYWLMPTHPRVTESVVAGLTTMMVGGEPFPLNNIIIWDREDSHLQRGGYVINRGSTGVRCFGTNNEYTNTKYELEAGKRPQGISRILTEQCDYLINLSVLKSHGLAGVTLSLKNHYGTFESPWDSHENCCDPAISNLNAVPVIRQKQVISICDALFGSTIDADQPPTVKPKSLMFSEDPVALDYTGTKLLESYGAKNADLNGKAKHVVTSAASPLNLGVCDPDRIESIVIKDPSSSGVGPASKRRFAPASPKLQVIL
jgi:uncharacterized protein (DUF362 family)